MKKAKEELNDCTFKPDLKSTGGNNAISINIATMDGSSSQAKLSLKRNLTSPGVKSAKKITSPRSAAAPVHFGDYHKFRQENAPKTYNELEQYRREVQDYLDKKAPRVALRTERRDQEKQKMAEERTEVAACG